VEITLPALWYRLREAGWSWKTGRPPVPNGDPVALVWDNAAVHRAAVRYFPVTVQPLFLPPYSPELNPVERLFQELRRHMANRICASLAELEARLVEALKA